MVEKMNSNTQIKAGAFLSYLSIGINMITGIIYTPWIIGQIGKSDYGLYTLALSLITLFLVDFGLSAAASRFLSKYVAEGNHQKANDFCRYCVNHKCAVSNCNYSQAYDSIYCYRHK